jgi:hypothetical protein
MKKLLFVAFLLTSTAALAQTAPPAAAPSGQQQHEEKFEEHKAKILERISHHLQEVQQRQACVQAATTHEALKACMPERRGERGEHGGRGEGLGGGQNH